jgi:hypothetical protein
MKFYRWSTFEIIKLIIYFRISLGVDIKVSNNNN